MQEYLHRSRLGEALDALGLRALLLLISLGWFIALWGVRPSALTAGAALYGLLLMLYKKTRDGRLARREKRLRARIGGELALERLLTVPPERAHFEIVLLLSLKTPLVLLQAGEEGVVCSLRGKRTLVSFIQLPAEDQLDARLVLEKQRQARALRAEGALLCVPCPVSPGAQRQAQGEIETRFFSREALIALLGAQNPATDAQLVSLGRRARAPRRWRGTALEEKRIPRYLLYGGLLLGMYLCTGAPFYALPGVACLLLATACRIVARKKREIL